MNSVLKLMPQHLQLLRYIYYSFCFSQSRKPARDVFGEIKTVDTTLRG